MTAPPAVGGVLIDSDVFIDHLRGARRLVTPSQGRVAYSTITRCELFAGRFTNEEVVATLLAPFLEIGVDRSVAERAGRIRRTTGIRTPDAILAATALEHRLTLVTRNARDFAAVAGLSTSPSFES